MIRSLCIVFSFPLLALAHDFTYTHEQLCFTQDEIDSALMTTGTWLNNIENKKLKICVTSQDSAVQIDAYDGPEETDFLRTIWLESSESENFERRSCEIVKGSERLQFLGAATLSGTENDHKVCVKVTYLFER